MACNLHYGGIKMRLAIKNKYKMLREEIKRNGFAAELAKPSDLYRYLCNTRYRRSHRSPLSPLSYALMKGDSEVVKYFLEKMKTLEDKKREEILSIRSEMGGDLPIHWAAEKNNAEAIELLKTLDPKIEEHIGLGNTKYGSTALFCAAWQGHQEAIKKLSHNRLKMS